MDNKLFDPIRNIWVEPLPEEMVRQKLLKRMIDELSFPKELICVEKRLDQFFFGVEIPAEFRRVDIICFAKNIHKDHMLYPLLLIECKASLITEEAIKQLFSYNYYIKAFFLAVANGDGVKTFWQECGEYKNVDFLLSFEQMIRAVSSKVKR